ncbi:MAG: hypothetical protein HY606_15535 [Planctomycetes bacterium]|nr:hypothetical protein [Planctomycetota bacterium]
MFIHFAFGELAIQGKIGEQTNRIIELILKEKRLKVSKCKEFIPIFPEPNSKPIPLKPFKVIEGRNDLVVASTDKDNRPSNNIIHYLPEEVAMISFIKISLSSLKNSKHAEQYGKFGIVLGNDFLVNKGIRAVKYYTEKSLFRDQLIIRFNTQLIKSRIAGEKTFEIPKEIQREITNFRKPASLFYSFKYSVSHIINFNSKGTTTGVFTYDRYPEGYDFTRENEHRIIFEDEEYLYFNEGDLFMVITPDSEAKSKIEAFLNESWKQKPLVKVYPTSKATI